MQNYVALPAGARPEPYRDGHGNECGPRFKRKKSFLENLFD